MFRSDYIPLRESNWDKLPVSKGPLTCLQESLAYPLNTEGAAKAVGVSLREFYYMLKRYRVVPGIVEKHGRKNLFFAENIELLRKLRRADALVASRELYKNSSKLCDTNDFERVLSKIREKQKGNTNV